MNIDTNENKTESCANCRFGASCGQLDHVACHVGPPAVIAVNMMTPHGPQAGMQSAWPMVPKGEWCGQWQRKLNGVQLTAGG